MPNNAKNQGASEAMARRLEDLEVKVAYQDRLIDELNQEVMTFTAKVEALEAGLARLQEAAKAGNSDIDPSHQKPPHY